MSQQGVHILPTYVGIVLKEETTNEKPNMEWNSNLRTPLVPRLSETTFTTFVCNSNHDLFPGLEASQMMISPIIEGNILLNNSIGSHEKKKRLTLEQVESLESSFQEEIKLEPDRKLKLARDLGLQPRQVAVWFQNRRARWRAKKLEHLYEVLKQEFDVVSREKHKLQEEVLRLKSMLIEQATRTKQISKGYTEASCEETVESTTIAIQSYKQEEGTSNSEQNLQGQYLFNVDDYNPVSSSYWGAFASSNYP